MALQTSGAISANNINVELGVSGTARFNMNDAEERALAGKPSGTIKFSDFYGKSSKITSVFTFTAGYRLTNLGNDKEWTVGYHLEDSLGTAVDVTSQLLGKDKNPYNINLYAFNPEKYYTAGPELIPGEPGPGETNFQLIRFSVFRPGGASTNSATFDFSSVEARLYNSSNQLIWSGTKTGPIQGQGTNQSYINMVISGATPDASDGPAEQAWLALYNVRNQNVRLELDWNN